MTAESSRAEALERLLAVLLEEEMALAALVGLALEEQRALIHNDHQQIERVAELMERASDGLDALDRQRQALAHELGAPERLEQLAPLAEELGVAAFGPARLRLAAAAAQLREAQEQNARLILNALRLRERWYGLLAGLNASTYGSGGRQDLGGGRGLLSRSA